LEVRYDLDALNEEVLRENQADFKIFGWSSHFS